MLWACALQSTATRGLASNPGSRSQIANRVIPAIFPNTERTFKFLADPEQIRKARELKRDGKLSIVLTADNADTVVLGEEAQPGGSGGSGCDAGIRGAASFPAGGLALLALVSLAAPRKL